ncbi:hypothetical protein J7M00_03490 [bacterium]|nr:hypothetical protein [bacterium]
MPRKCTVCAHPERAEIDQAIVDGVPYRAIACRYGVGREAVRRHAKNHLPRTLVKAHEAAEVARADDLLARAREYEARAVELLKKAEEENDYGTALRGIREARACLELLARMRGELEHEMAINFLESKDWITIRELIADALKPYPEAREALRKALLEFVEENQG